jgi:hypothetical protein
MKLSSSRRSSALHSSGKEAAAPLASTTLACHGGGWLVQGSCLAVTCTACRPHQLMQPSASANVSLYIIIAEPSCLCRSLSCGLTCVGLLPGVSVCRHPDKNANSTESTEKFQRINAACTCQTRTPSQVSSLDGGSLQSLQSRQCSQVYWAVCSQQHANLLPSSSCWLLLGSNKSEVLHMGHSSCL